MADKKLDLGKLFESDGDEVIQTEFVTLFIDEEKEELLDIPVPEEMQLKLNGLKFVQAPSMAEPEVNLVMYYGEFGGEGSDTHKLEHALRKHGDGEATLTVRITSPGGSISEGLQMIAIARECYSGGYTTVLQQDAASMGAMMFSSGETRVAYEHSSYMIHDWSGISGASGGINEKRIAFMNKNVDRAFRELNVDTGFITETEFQNLKHGDEMYMDCYELCVRGIATHVIVGPLGLSAEEYVEYYDSGFTINEFQEYKILESQECSAGPEKEIEINLSTLINIDNERNNKFLQLEDTPTEFFKPQGDIDYGEEN